LQIKALFPLVDEVLKRFTKHISDEVAKNHKEAFDAREICAKFTTDVVSSCIFDADAQSFTKDEPEIREVAKKLFQFPGWVTFWFIMYSFFPVILKIYKVKIISKEIEDFFSNLMLQAVEQREKHPVNRDDYLAYLISLRNKKQFSELDMAAHGVTFFIGETLN
jgi:cytochrome P450